MTGARIPSAQLSAAQSSAALWAAGVALLAMVLLADAVSAMAQTVDPELLDDAGRIIGSPDAGPDPEHSGDRGGWAQFATLAVMMAGIVFIAWRVRIGLIRR